MTQLDPQYYPLMVDVLDDGLFSVDAETRISSFNRRAEQITGYRASQALGRPCREIFRSDLCDTVCPLKESIQSRLPVKNRRVRIRSRDGRSIPVSVSTAPLVTPDGQLIGGVELFRDLSGFEHLRQRLEGTWRFDDIVGRSPAMQRLFELLPLVARSSATVLITGASGTGKELVARAIHNHSPRQHGPFVAFNCAAVPETLLESELFGHERGAFTDALQRRCGRVEQAQGGTLFLDEIGDLPLGVQVKLLRFLQERRFERLGSNTSEEADVRVVAATHQDLTSRVAEGLFREDLYYRIHVVHLALPRLADRREDIPLLVRHLVARFRALTGKPITGISGAAMSVFMRYPWPGNVRELENAIESAFVVAQGDTINVEHLPPHLFARPAPILSGKDGTRPSATGLPAAAGGSGAAAGAPATPLPARSGLAPLGPPPSLADLEREAVLAALREAGGVKSRAARILGIHRTTLYRKLARLGLAD